MGNPMTPQLNADESAYIIDGREWQRVTNRFSKYFNDAHFKEFHKDRGTAVHKWAEIVLPGLPYPHEPHPALAGYVVGLEKFKAEVEYECTAMEVFVHSKIYGFAGQVDWIGMITDGRQYPAILDLKTGAASKPPPTAKLQTAAYRQAYSEMYGAKEGKRRRYGLQVRPDGTYRLECYDKEPGNFRVDLNTYASMVNVFNWERMNGYA